MAFSRQTVDAAWSRQGGCCAHCGKSLARSNRDYGRYGAWHPHHRKPESKDGTDTLGNCVILCINEPGNCHFNVGHKGNWANYAPLSDSDLPYLYEGQRITRRPLAQMLRTQPMVKKIRRVKPRRLPPSPPQPSITTIRSI
jgi:hypothetical protein